MTPVEVGRRLRQLRQDAGLSQVELAERADSSQPEISDWERGRRRPGVTNLLRLARALGVHPGRLLED